MSADSPRRSNIRGVPAIVPPEEVSDRSVIDSVAGFINDVTLANQPIGDPKDTIIWARFESTADISDPRFGDDWELEGNVAPPLLLILGYGLGVQIWAIPANGEAVEVLSWRHGIVSALRILPKPVSGDVSRADEPIDLFSDRRPLMAICDGGPSSQGGSNPQFCSVNFLSLRTGTQVKTIKFKNPVLDILANRTSVVVTFHERIAIFDARTLEDRLTVTTCFPSPGINPNPVALGSRWLAYSENKLLAAKRSGGGCDGDGVASYTATVLNAAKSLGKGLRDFTEQVTAGLTGTTGSGTTSKSASFDSCGGDIRQPGIVTILDIKYAIKDMSPTSGTPISVNGTDPIVAHFIAHSEALVAMEFDNSGMMLLTADKRGHNFHVFRIQPHPVGSTLAAVHHLYVLHRGDTSAKVQNISFSLDTRWVAVSTLRGTTHVFPITPYGGPPTARTHSNLHVVNKLSSFHHSAGLTADGRSSSPISHTDTTNFSQQLMPYFNQTMPPFPRPTVVLPLAQLRQPFTLSNNAPASAAAPKTERGNRQRLSSLSDDNGKPLSVCAVFAKSRSWLLDPPNLTRDGPAHKLQRKAVDSLFVMAGHGALIQYDLDVSYVAKDKKCDDKSIDLDVEAKAQWNVGRRDPNTEIMPPLPSDNWLVKDRMSCALVDSSISDDIEDRSDCWLAQVEIITHAGPSRRLWMGPQFVFKTYNTPSGSSLSHIDSEAVEIGMTTNTKTNPERSSPLNMPVSSGNRSSVPVLIESGSYSSIEQSPKLMDRFRHDYLDSDYSLAHGESRLKEDLADAMRESPSVTHKNTGLTPTLTQTTVLTTSQTSSESSQSYHQIIENVVNPLGTVTTVNLLAEAEDPLADNPYVKFSPEDYVIHENCDESLFRPVVVFCDNKKADQNLDQDGEFTKPPALIENKLIVPVIDKSLHMVLTKKEAKRAEDKFEELSNINKMSKKSNDAHPHTTQSEENIKIIEEEVKIKEEVLVSKGKKNKKKVELVKEPTPPRDVKKKTKKEEISKVAENEIEKLAFKKEDVKEASEKSIAKTATEEIPTMEKEVKSNKDCKLTTKSEDKSFKQENIKIKEEINEGIKAKEEPEIKKKDTKKVEKETPKIVERKKSLDKSIPKILADNKNKEMIPKPVERKKSLEPEPSKDENKNKEVIPKPAERKKSLEPEPVKESKAKETQKNIQSKVKEEPIEKNTLPEDSDSTSSEEQSLPSVKDVAEEEIISGSKISETAATEVESKNKLKQQKDDKKLEDKNEESPIENKSKEKVLKNKKKENSPAPIESEVKEETLKNDKKSKEDSSHIKIVDKVEEAIPEAKKTVTSTSSDKKKYEILDKPQNDVKIEIAKESSSAKEIILIKEKDQNKSAKKQTKTTHSRSSSPSKEVEDITSLKTIQTETKCDESSKKKSKSKKQSRESSPEVKESQPSAIEPEESPRIQPVVEVDEKEKLKDAITEIPQKETVEATELTMTTNKKKNKNKKASRESSPEITNRKNSIKETKPADLPDEVFEGVQEVEATVIIKKKNKNKKASRDNSPEVPLRKNSIKDIKTPDLHVAEDNPIKKTKSNALDKSEDPDKEYKVIVKEISPPQEEPKITDFLKFVDHFNKATETDDYLYKVTVKDISPPETDHDFPSLSFSTKKSKKNKKPTPEMVLPIEKDSVPAVETLSPFQPLDKITPAEEGATLINFESPESTTKINFLDFERPKGFPDDIIFAICGNLSDPNVMIESEKEFLTSSSTASASDETTDETTITPEKKKKTKKLVSPCNLNDDEELRPLISTTADNIEATPTSEVLYQCKYSEKDAKSSDSSSDTGGGSYAIPEATVVPPQPEQQPTNQQHQNSKKKIKRRKR